MMMNKLSFVLLDGEKCEDIVQEWILKNVHIIKILLKWINYDS